MTDTQIYPVDGTTTWVVCFCSTAPTPNSASVAPKGNYWYMLVEPTKLQVQKKNTDQTIVLQGTTSISIPIGQRTTVIYVNGGRIWPAAGSYVLTVENLIQQWYDSYSTQNVYCIIKYLSGGDPMTFSNGGTVMYYESCIIRYLNFYPDNAGVTVVIQTEEAWS
jgi:hypothetical protein